MTKNKDRWSALSMKERADLIKLYVNNGTTNLSSIRSHYNKFGDGGDTGEDGKSNSNPLLGPILKIANVILQSDRISDTQRDRLLEFAMRISGGNVNSDSVVKASEYVLSKYGRKALFQVLSTDTPVSDIVDQSIQESGYTMGDNYGGVAFSNDFWDNDDFIWNNAESDDFVDAYVKGTTPYESAGVIRVGSEDPGRLGRYSRYIKKNYPDRDIPTYQAHKDTLDTDLVKYLDTASTALETSTFGANADEGSYQEAFPFGSEENRGFFDAAGYNIELVKGPDGKIYGRKSDMYDFLPSDFNDKWVENDQVQGLVESIDRMGHPFIFRTPWFEATEENVPKEILLEYTEQNKKSLGGKINRFDTGGDKDSAEREIWERKFKDLPQGFKQAVLQLVKELNYNIEDAEELFNSGALRAPLDAKFRNTQPGRVRQNDSPTSDMSTDLEDRMNTSVYNRSDAVRPNMQYAIPYIEDLEIKVPGVGRTTTNALDSLAKYAYEARIPLEEALGLAAQETALGAIPLTNYKDIPKNATEEEKQEVREYNRALGNSSYFRNYGIIPAENIVRDFRYNLVEDPISRDIPPLLHAFEYWKKGYYNRGDSNHTEDVKRKGREVMNTEVIQEWVKNSKFAQRVINLFK